jgi:hypothetical protein
MTRSALAILTIAALASPAAAFPISAQSLRSTAPAASPNATVVQGCNTPKLSYGNGPLIQKVKVFDVFYNQGNTLKDMLTAYFTAITASPYFDWLTEYNTTNYKISRGSYLGLYEDSNSATTKKTLTDSAVQTYLSGLIDGAKVPAPDDDTIYMIFFPSPVSISLQGSNSCASGGFCAYHSSYTHGGKKVRYGVMPDQTTGGCATGCGPGTGFQNTTDVASHELIEAVTDPDGGSGWYDTVDNGCGEIGDICAVGAGETAMVSGYAVQKEWSNKNNDCIATDPNVVINDFTVAASSTSVMVPVGGMATTTITLTKTAGVAENATLSIVTPVATLPATFAPTSITSAGGTSTMTISAAATATVGMTSKLTVKATGMSAMPTVDINVTVIDAPDMAQPNTGGTGGTGGGGSGGSGGGTGTGGNGGSGGNGNNGGGGASGCSVGGADIVGSWAVAGLLLLALAFRRRRA